MILLVIHGTSRVDCSVAKGPKFRPQSTKMAEKNLAGPEKLGAELLADLSKKGRKGAELLFRSGFSKNHQQYLSKTILINWFT
jgi:hypothetical protein